MVSTELRGLRRQRGHWSRGPGRRGVRRSHCSGWGREARHVGQRSPGEGRPKRPARASADLKGSVLSAGRGPEPGTERPLAAPGRGLDGASSALLSSSDSCPDAVELLEVVQDRNLWKEVWAHCDSETFKTFSRRVCRGHLLQHSH